MSLGAEKSGKPCDKLTAPCFSASRVISRMTDSVNKLALRDTWRLLEIEGVVITSPTKGHKSTQNVPGNQFLATKRRKRSTIGLNQLCVFCAFSWPFLGDDL